MATNPVHQGNHPSNAEEQEILEKPTLAQLAKQTHTRQILHVPDFLNAVDNKILGNQIIQALENNGILRLCTYPFSGIYEEDVVAFYLHSSIDNLSIKYIVNETPIEIKPSDLSDVFDLPETDVEVDNHVFDHQEFMYLIGGNSPVTPKFSGLKKKTLKWEFEKFIDILYKCLTDAKLDKPDETFVLKKFQQHMGYGFVISEIMRKKGEPLRKPKNVASFKYLFRNPKTLRKRKPTEASTSKDTVVIVLVEVICEGVVTAQDDTLVETNLDESQHGNATNVPTVTQSHEMDVTENLSNTLEDTNENLFENLIDAQVIDEEHFMRKHAEGDQILWIAKKNQELKKGKSPANSNMNMLKEIEQYAGHKGEYLSDGRSFEECVRWFVLGVLPGNNVTEAYSYYITGQVYDEYFVDKYVEDFRKLREHINKMLEKRSMEKSRT
nr:protein FAR1-RELATED SEQUENCE 5-like [Ipomoea batatas]